MPRDIDEINRVLPCSFLSGRLSALITQADDWAGAEKGMKELDDLCEATMGGETWIRVRG